MYSTSEMSTRRTPSITSPSKVSHLDAVKLIEACPGARLAYDESEHESSLYR